MSQIEKLCCFCGYIDYDCRNKEGKLLCEKDKNYRYANDTVAEVCDGFAPIMYSKLDLARQASKDCPVKRGRYSSPVPSTCYITTAIVDVLNMADDTEEMQVLRSFRKNVLSSDPKYRDILLQYDYYGPRVASMIHTSDNGIEVAIDVFQIIRECSTLIKDGNYSEAVSKYYNMTRDLIDIFGITPEIPEYIKEKYDQSKGGHGHLHLKQI